MISSFYISESRLWKTSLGNDSVFGEKKSALVNALEAFRANTAILAAEISRDLPEFTVHDISHIDALWEMASIIAGPQITLNPIEAFVFGAAVLLHDLGMASAAYVDGVDFLIRGIEWEDALELALRKYWGRVPTDEEKNFPLDEVRNIAIANRLRTLHAIHAETIPQLRWETEDGNQYRLLEDQELLEDLGELIGRIAASHGWPIEKVENELNFEVGPPSSYPSDWGIDVLKIACLLRAADASHIDKRRAPGFLRALRNPQGLSGEHWKFQNRLSRPTVKNNQLIYNSTRVFTERDMEAWWLAHDTLCMINKELYDVEKLLKEHRTYTFDANGVKGIESPNRLTSYIRVNGWIPLDAKVYVSNLPKLVNKLGGEGLYGKNPTATIRELIANSCDAIEASRKMGGLSGRNGKVIVRVGKDTDGQEWLEVEDNGIGMSVRTLTDKLLDFGTSYWDTEMMLEEHPGLFSSGFSPTGKFGIGFFSVFMFGDKIRVTSRSIHNGPDDTYVLFFGEGLYKRPVVLKSKPFDRMRDSGTIVRIYLDDISGKINDMYMYLSESRTDSEMDFNLSEKFEFVIRKLAPCLSADLFCKLHNEPEVQILKSDDWKSISNYELLLRLSGFSENAPKYVKLEIDKYKELVQPIFSETGEMLGRAVIGGAFDHKHTLYGMITCGGLLMESLWRVYGIFVGDVNSASRNSGAPIVSNEVLAKWATEQGELIKSNIHLFENDEILDLAAVVLLLGGNTGELPICETHKGYLSYSDVKNADWPHEVILLQDATKYFLEIENLNDNVLVMNMGVPAICNNREWPVKSFRYSRVCSIEKLVREGILESWGVTEKEMIHYFKDEESLESRVIGRNSSGAELSEKVYVMRKQSL